MVASSDARKGGHDQAALDEIELAGELMIAATASAEERLAPERIDEVLLDREGSEGSGGGEGHEDHVNREDVDEEPV